MDDTCVVYIERKPNHYVGPDISVTICTNDNGLGLSDIISTAIKRIIKENEASTD